MLKEPLKTIAAKMNNKEKGADICIVFADTRPVMILPLSKKSTSLFYRWGMEENCIGIDPPSNPLDFFISIPNNWLINIATLSSFIEALGEITEGEYFLQEVHLPQPLLVVH